MERYFMIKQESSPSFGWHAGVSFVKIVGDGLEFMEGDRSYFNLFECDEGKIKLNKRAKLSYNIHELKTEGELAILVATDQASYAEEQSRRKIHSMRRLR